MHSKSLFFYLLFESKLEFGRNFLGNYPIPEDSGMDIDTGYDSESRNAPGSSMMDTDWQIPKVEFQSGNQDSSVQKRYNSIVC